MEKGGMLWGDSHAQFIFRLLWKGFGGDLKQISI